MSLFAWCALFAGHSLFARWVLSWGGAEWMEGWKAAAFIDWIHAGFWEAEQIRLYFLLLWLLHAAWFAVGLFVPGARALPW
ncbi:hypothetical protein QFW77_15995 [Luteimonas sp. RD2P54]|uniref:Uncharacterized protein n=1 Tax=Luteimonas endophytica TaxID=3042023 RepID=A0ABT6JCE3_9GAMM|nr:hypothetical protein [Luteimonas endophytica]MDH5824477.1 hypothetical protein [Luteimonas endophytica]